VALQDVPSAIREMTRAVTDRGMIAVDEAQVPEVAELLGDGSLLFSSDYPHWDSPFPNSVRIVRERQDLSETLKRRVLCDNVAACYGIPAEIPA